MFNEVAYLLNDLGYIVSPEITDVSIIKINKVEGNVEIDVLDFEGGLFRFFCEDCYRLRIDKFGMQNLTSSFYVSSKVNLNLTDENILQSLRSDESMTEWDEYGLSFDLSYAKVKDGQAVLFGNDPSAGAEIAIICRNIFIFRES